jgi:hypothetical protein
MNRKLTVKRAASFTLASALVLAAASAILGFSESVSENLIAGESQAQSPGC